MNIQENVSLKELTTFNIGGNARFFVRIKNVAELQDVLAFAREKKLALFILGGGSNILVDDAGFPGLVLKIDITDIVINSVKENKVLVSAGAGVEWDSFVAGTVQQALYGLENLSLIPGTVGAAPVQNIGAYGSEVQNTIVWVDAVDSDTGILRRFSHAECAFAYRTSFFKTPAGKKYIIIRVGFELEKNGTLNTSYRDIADHIKNNSITEQELTLQKVRDIVIDIRTKKLPSLKEYGTAGSFFKNPIIKKELYIELLKDFPSLPGYSNQSASAEASTDTIKVPAAWILDNLCGFKGFRDGEVGVYKNQALVLINFGNATSGQIKNLAEKMIACVKEKTNIILEREVEYI